MVSVLELKLAGDNKSIIDSIEDFSNYTLNKKTDLKTLFELSLRDNKESLFTELSFTAKYVQGLMRVLKSGSENSEVKSLDHIKKDFTQNMQKITEQMKEILKGADDQIKRYFDTTYFDMSLQGLQNLRLILSDLEWTKKYLNEQKRLNKK
jgi:hypothetical protein